MPDNARTTEQLRGEIETERERLADAVETLRTEMGEAANVTAKLRSNLPVAAIGALGGGFVLAGGIGATMRLVFRRGREGTEKARLGRFTVVERH